MKSTFILLLILSTSILHFSCNENEDPTNLNGKVEFYEIEQFETIDNTDEIDESTVTTKNNPLLKYEDLLSYNSKEYKFEISEHGKKLLEGPPTKSGAFAIKVNEELIYTCYFVPGYSSRLLFWNVIDPIISGFRGECFVHRNVLQGGNQTAYSDKRNDPRILEVFRKDNKLVE